MSLDDLGNLGEFVGAVGVVLTLIYLAVQIRQNTQQLSQNTRSSRGAAFHAVTSTAANAVARLTESDEMARIFKGGLAGERLSDLEVLRFDALLVLLFNAYEQLFYQQRDAAVETELWESRVYSMLWYLRQPGGLAFWRRNRKAWSQSFREYVDGQLPDQAA